MERSKLKNIEWLKKAKPPYDVLLEFAATFMSICESQAKTHEILQLDIAKSTAQMDRFANDLPEEIAKIYIAGITKRAKLAAMARHSQPGGSHDKQTKIREVWATGKYSSRTKCAEKEHENFGMSFSTAQKALRNTPDPKNRASARKG